MKQFFYFFIIFSFVCITACGPRVVHRWEDDKMEIGELSMLGVKEVLAGDRIRLDSDRIVQYIGINAPDIGEPFFEESLEANLFLLRRGKVFLQFKEPLKNNKGNYMAYAYIPAKGALCFLNRELLQFGYAKVDRNSQHTEYMEDFLELEKHAKSQKLGIWKH